MTTLDDVVEALQKLRPYARKLTKNRDDADDLLQMTFLRASRFLDKFGSGNLGAWLCTIMYRRFLDTMRHGAGKAGQYSYRRRHVSLEAMPEGWDIPCEPTAADEWDCNRVLEMIDALPPKHRDTLTMLAESATYKEIAKSMGCGVTTAKTRIYRARELLLEQLAA